MSNVTLGLEGTPIHRGRQQITNDKFYVIGYYSFICPIILHTFFLNFYSDRMEEINGKKLTRISSGENKCVNNTILCSFVLYFK